MRRHAINAMGSSYTGELQLVKLAKSGIIPDSLQTAAGEALSDSWRGDIRELGQTLTGETQIEQTDLPPIAELASKTGEPGNGKVVFEQSCQICHRVNGQGTEYGPALSEIGAKLPKDGLYDAILNPNSGISFGYEGYTLTLNDGTKVTGIIQSETESEVSMVVPGGYTMNYSKSEIAAREEMDQSLMPENLHSSMSQQELVDLVEYLSSLE